MSYSSPFTSVPAGKGARIEMPAGDGKIGHYYNSFLPGLQGISDTGGGLISVYHGDRLTGA